MKNILLSIISLSIVQHVLSCTTFFINTPNHKVFGRNYDWMIGTGKIIQNKRGVIKNSLVKQNEQSISWTSKYGSVTFNQFDKEFPLGGMNEKGLVVEVL